MNIILYFQPAKDSALYKPMLGKWPIDVAQPLPATLTTDHPSSSYGLPVLLIDGTAYGPGDLSGHLAGATEDLRGSAHRGFLPGERDHVLAWIGDRSGWTVGSDCRPGSN